MSVQEVENKDEPVATLKSRAVGKAIKSPEMISLQRKLIACSIIALVVGFAAGLLVMKHRHNAADSIAAVNGDVITKDELFNTLQLSGGAQAVHTLVLDRLQLQFAAQKNLVPTDAAALNHFNDLKSQPNFDLILRNSRMPEVVYKANMKLTMAEEAVFAQGITVTDDDINNFYIAQSNPNNPHALFYRPPVIRLQAISCLTRKDAQSAIDQIDSGMPFDVVAQNVSLDPSKANGGNLSPLVFGNSPLTKAPDVERQVFALRTGEMSEPIALGKGWWVFKCNQYSPPVQIPLAQVKDQARLGAEVAKGVSLNGLTVRQEFATFMQTANIQSFWPQYDAAVGKAQH